jgi:hypothetical protein
MDGWRLDADRARAVLTKAESDAEGIAKATTTMETAIGHATAAVGTGSQAAAALADLSTDPLGIDLLAVKNQVATAISATRSSISDYEQGDEQMATDTAKHVADVGWGGSE